MTQQKPVNFQAIEEQLTFIDKETNMEMKENTFFEMAKNYARMRRAQSAEAAEQLIFDWMVKFHEQGRLDKPPQPRIIGALLQAWAKSGHPSSGEKAEQLLDKVEDMARKGSLFFPLPTPTFNIVIKAYAIHGDTEKAQAVFDRCMLEINEGSQSVRPDIFAWNTLLDTCARSGNRDAVEVVEKFFGEMQRSYEEGLLENPPNTTTYNAILNACAQFKQPKRAEFWLREMIKDYENGKTSAQPDDKSFGIVFYAHIKSRKPDAWEAAEELFDEMQRCHKEGIVEDQPDTRIYNNIIDACAKSKQPQRAEFWLRKMHKNYKNGNTSVRPDEQSFIKVIDAHEKSGNPDAWKMAENLFAEIQQSHKDGILKDPPDTIAYNYIINVCARFKQPQKAEFWLREMHKDYENGNVSAKPNCSSFNGVIDAWAKSGNPDAWKAAERLLDETQRSYKEGILVDPPNVITYNCVLDACAKSKQPQRAEFWLKEMYKDYKNGNESAQPNDRSFGTIINAWANLETQEGAERCEMILNDMVRYAKTTELPVRPNTVSYSTVMMGYARAGLPRKAEAVLQRQYNDFLAGNKRAALNSYCFNAVIHGWAKANQMISGEKAEHVLNRMLELHKQGIVKQRPDSYTYSTVINTWAILGEPEKASQIFHRMLDHYKNGNRAAKPNSASFNSLLQAHSNAKMPNAGELADALLEGMEEIESTPDVGTLVSVVRCWECSMGHDPRAPKRLKELQETITKLRGRSRKTRLQEAKPKLIARPRRTDLQEVKPKLIARPRKKEIKEAKASLRPGALAQFIKAGPKR